MVLRWNAKKRQRHDPFGIKEGHFSYGRIESSPRRRWIEEAFIGRHEPKEIVARVTASRNFTQIVVFLLLAFSFLAGRTAWLQVVRGDYYYSLAEGNRIREQRIEAHRGVIYDRGGRLLVKNSANFLLYLHPAEFMTAPGEREAVWEELGLFLDAADIEAARAASREMASDSAGAGRPLVVADRIEYEAALGIMLRISAWPGFVLSDRPLREYNSYAPSLSHILGYTGKISEEEMARAGKDYLPIDYIGKMGVEYFWESELRGKNGYRRIEVDARGREIKALSHTVGADGHDLVLAIDLDAQRRLEEILAAQLKRLNLSRAAAAVLDPQSGEVIALVSLPAYENNAFARGLKPAEYEAIINHPDQPLFNRVVSGEYPSGSTIKPVWAAAALEEGIINAQTSFLSVGGIRIGEWFFPDWRAGGHGQTNVRRALAESVNTFFYYIGGGYDDFRGLGVDRMVNYARWFGLGVQTGIDLAGESDGFLPTPAWKEGAKGERWYIGDTYHLSIGQGDLLVTPLQVAAYTAAFANGGTLYRPRIVKRVIADGGAVVREIEAEAVRRDFINPRHIELVKEGMRLAVTGGSARALSALKVTAAGKTGTAQWSSKEPTHAWFTGFAPFDNPALVITVLIEKGGEGSETAVPVAGDFLDWYFGRADKEEKTGERLTDGQ